MMQHAASGPRDHGRPPGAGRGRAVRLHRVPAPRRDRHPAMLAA